jgi:hypothetical protein
MAMARGANWTREEEKKLVKLASEGVGPDAIGEILARSENAIIIHLAEVVNKKTQWTRLVKQLKEFS